MSFPDFLFRLLPEDGTPAQLVLAKACPRGNRGREQESNLKQENLDRIAI
ncbi:MAG: hypothetical protein OXJ52_06630 [Oligoflexia bacterium]|nr:hypothetical protein [Oligoflexia bacterium]